MNLSLVTWVAGCIFFGPPCEEDTGVVTVSDEDLIALGLIEDGVLDTDHRDPDLPESLAPYEHLGGEVCEVLCEPFGEGYSCYSRDTVEVDDSTSILCHTTQCWRR